MKSTDAGQTWAVVDTIDAIVATAIIPVLRSLVFAPNASVYMTTGSGIFKSADSGMSWQETDTGLRVHDIRMLVGDPLNPAILYAGDNHALFQSVDGAAKWAQLATFQVFASPGVAPFPPAIGAELDYLLIDLRTQTSFTSGRGGLADA